MMTMNQSHRAIYTVACIALTMLVGNRLCAGSSEKGDHAGSSSSIYESATTTTPATHIDNLVLARLLQLGIQPATPCSDAVFVRRVYLDVIGKLPTAQEAREFLENKASDKRQLLIDRLLARPEFADYWTMKWGDLLRMQSEFPMNIWPNAVQEYTSWVHEQILRNRPYDQFARELLTSSGNNFRDPPINFYRAVPAKKPIQIAQTVALTFMGERADKWPKERLAGMAVFFAQVGYKPTGEWKAEIVFFDPEKATNDTARAAVFPDGTKIQLEPDQDPRVIFTDWLLSPQNPWFARNIVNRVWGWLQGRAIIDPPDDLRADNPPSNPELLAYLEKELRASRYDLKQLYRLILNSQAYQLSPVAKTDKPAGINNFASYPLRRLEAEVLIDIINQVTGTKESYVNGTPAPFSYPSDNQPTVLLTDAAVSSSFLAKFGRPSHATGVESERNNQISPDQELHLLNSNQILDKLRESSQLKGLSTADLYLTILSRLPSEKESQIAQSASKEDLAWALINTAEFEYRH